MRRSSAHRLVPGIGENLDDLALIAAIDWFWVASAAGKGELGLEWEPRPGDGRAVLMNGDGSRGVTAELELGARTEVLRWVGVALLVASLLAAAGAAALYAVARAAR